MRGLELLERLRAWDEWPAVSEGLDFLHEDPRRIWVAAASIALLLHGFVFILGGAGLLNSMADWTQAAPRESTIALNLMSSTSVLEPEKAVPEVKAPELLNQRRQVVDTTHLLPADRPPEQSPFEGAANTRAGSIDQTTGSRWMPAQIGRDLPGLEFRNEDLVISEGTGTQGSRQAASQGEGEGREISTKPAQERVERPMEQRRSLTDIPLRADGKLAVPRNQIETDGLDQRTARVAEVTAGGSARALQLTRRRVQMDGTADLNQDLSVAVEETPLGRYKARLYAAIGTRWHILIDRNRSLITPGFVRISFTVLKSGRITNIRVLEGRNVYKLQEISLQSIETSSGSAGPFPPELLDQMGGSFNDEVSFTVYSY